MKQADFPYLWRVVFTWLMCLCAAPAVAQSTPSVLVRTAIVEETVLTQSLSVFGVLDPDPDQVMSLSLPHAGLINRVWVRLGQRVRSGDPLLELVTAPDAHMQYLQAQSAVDFARGELERRQRLLDEQLATKSQVDTAERELKDAQATLTALQQRGMDSAQDTVRAPVDGIITRLDVSQGMRVQSDTTALLIAAEKRLVARLGVEPEDLSDIQPGTPATLRSVFVPGIEVKTEIREVHAMVNPDTLLVEVLAPIPEQQIHGLVLGTRITGEIHLQTRAGLTVPRSAILGVEPDTYLFLIRDQQAKRVPVRTVLEVGDRVEISGTLNAGDVVAISGNYQLSDGMAVREKPE